MPMQDCVSYYLFKECDNGLFLFHAFRELQLKSIVEKIPYFLKKK